MFGVRKIVKLLRDYCENASLVGLSYIANQKIHLTERIFWIICIVISAGGSYYVIREYQTSFESKAISLVLEDTRPQDKSQFPALSACQNTQVAPDKLKEYVQRTLSSSSDHYCRDDVEDYLIRIIFEKAYSSNSLDRFCHYCQECPLTGYKEIAALIRHNCTEMFENCQWNGKPFNCCDYFLPLQTPNGICFAMNSVQATERDGPHWLDTEFGWDVWHGELKLQFNTKVELQLLNAEDVPFFILKDNLKDLQPGYEFQVQFRVQTIINDPDVREVSPDSRRCRFQDEIFEDSGYEYYSYSACVADCLKRLQLATCNCTFFNYITNKDEKSTSCDMQGIICLDRRALIKPDANIMQPWNTNSIQCKCLPSCTDHAINIIEETFEEHPNLSTTYAVQFRQILSTEQFRRQAVRTRLDVVVTIGGILGLFMGASILSGIEIVYFFLIRICYARN